MQRQLAQVCDELCSRALLCCLLCMRSLGVQEGLPMYAGQLGQVEGDADAASVGAGAWSCVQQSAALLLFLHAWSGSAGRLGWLPMCAGQLGFVGGLLQPGEAAAASTGKCATGTVCWHVWFGLAPCKTTLRILCSRP